MIDPRCPERVCVRGAKSRTDFGRLYYVIRVITPKLGIRSTAKVGEPMQDPAAQVGMLIEHSKKQFKRDGIVT
jgi:hypothetical protein